MKTRADVVVRRTYSRPKNAAETEFESWEEICERVKEHQQWLWERAKGKLLNKKELAELEEFKQLMIDRKVSVSGRTLWLGGTDIAKRREASQFNCSFTEVETVYDVVDVLWLLMQGCGVGFKPITGTLNGFFKPLKEAWKLTKKPSKMESGQSKLETQPKHGQRVLVSSLRESTMLPDWFLTSQNSDQQENVLTATDGLVQETQQ
jgi:ribonucleoside-triphosphate reductase